MLPKLTDLISGDVDLKRDQSDLNVLLNQSPPSAWIREHPFARGVRYIPIERIEYLLTRLFLRWRVEVKEIKIIANSVCVTARLHYQNIENNEWSWQDGVGAAPLQTDKGAGAIDWNSIKSDAVMKAAPAAKTFAVKDAAEQIGKIFGKDLNRKDEIIYDTLIGLIPQEKPTSKSILFAHELIRTCTGDEDYKEIMEGKVNDPELTVSELDNIITELQINQNKKY
jgi:hypothetical protein